MKKRCLAALLATTLAHPALADTGTTVTAVAETQQATEAELQPVGFSITYRLRYSAFKADLTLQLLPDPDSGHYHIRATTEARGLARMIRPGQISEEAHFVYTDNALTPLKYRLDGGTKSGEDSGEISFNWEEGSAHSMYEQTVVTLPLEGEVYDRISADVVVMMDLRNGKQPRTLRIAEKNALRDYRLSYQGDDTVTVPAGTFKTVKYLREREGSSRSTLIWYAPAANYLPVRMEQLKHGKTVVTSEATELSIAEAPTK